MNLSPKSAQTVFLSFLFLLISTCLWAQGTVSGKIVGKNGTPLSGATISEVGKTDNATTSGNDGSFTLRLSVSGTDVSVSYVGYANRVVTPAQIRSGNVTLVPDQKQMGEVIVVDYGTQLKKDLTGSVVSIKGDALRQTPAVNAIKIMQGLVAGLDIASTSNNPNSSPVIRIRGNRSINAGNDPLIVTDGLPFGGTMNDVNAGDIKSIEVLKDASATAIYGSGGANGVILITTNRGVTRKTSVSYNGYYAVQSPIKKLALMTSAEFAEFRRQAERNAGRYNPVNPSASPDELMFYFRDAGVKASVLAGYDANGNYDPGKVKNYDWLDAVTQTGVQQEHQLSVLPGTEKSQTSFCLGYFDNKGVVKGYDYNRYNLRLTCDNQLYKGIKIGGTLATSINKSITTDNLYNLAGQVNPLAPIYDATGLLINNPASDNRPTNPLAVARFHYLLRYSQKNTYSNYKF